MEDYYVCSGRFTGKINLLENIKKISAQTSNSDLKPEYQALKTNKPKTRKINSTIYKVLLFKSGLVQYKAHIRQCRKRCLIVSTR